VVGEGILGGRAATATAGSPPPCQLSGPPGILRIAQLHPIGLPALKTLLAASLIDWGTTTACAFMGVGVGP